MKLHITKIEDHEGFGRCSECGRENLRWIVVLSDGTRVGTECAKKVCGIAVNTRKLGWLASCTEIDEYSTKWETFTLYAHKTIEGRTLLAINGVLYNLGGGGREAFQRYTRIYNEPGEQK